MGFTWNHTMANGGISINLIKQMALGVISYSLGYFQWSIIWIILPLILGKLRDKMAKDRLLKRDFYRNLALNDEKTVLSTLSNLPAWVCFPDVERAEWLNKIIKQLWPNVNNYVHDIIKQVLETKLNKKMGKYGLSGLVFEKLVVGTVPFRVGGIVVFENVSSNEIVFDMDITYAGDCDITLRYSKMRGSIKDFQLYGKLRIILKPLINTLPLAGGVQMFFLNPPDIDFTLDGLAGILEFPMLSEMLKKLILDTICSVIVLPNKYPIRLSKKVSKQDIKVPNPKGVLRIHVVQARHLMKKDLTMVGQKISHTSDPYAVLTIGDQEYKTRVIEHTTKPKWDYWCEFVIEEINGVYLFISLWDDDTFQEDEPLGRAKVQVSKLVEKKTADMWLNLEDVKHGQVQLRTTWLTLSTKHDDIKNTLFDIDQLQDVNLSSAILTVYVNSASDLVAPTSKKMDLYVLMKIGKEEKNTKVFKKLMDPVWEEGFVFLVSNPEVDYIVFNVMDDKEEESLGEFIYSISALLGEHDFRIENKTFPLSQCETEAKIIVSMALQILTSASSGENISDNRHSPEFSTNDLSEHSSLSRSSSVSSTDSDSTDSSSKKSDIPSPAKIKLTLRYSVQRQKLIVVVHHVEKLNFDETKGLYVKLYLLPDRHKDTKRKTQVIRTSKNPVFDETFEFLISQDELNNKHLEVSVCEERVIKNEAIEKVVIDLDKLSLVLPHSRLFTLFTKTHES